MIHFLGVRLLTPGIARGYERRDAGRLVYAAEGLAMGEHTHENCCGEGRARRRDPWGAYVALSIISLFSGKMIMGMTRLIIDSEFNLS